MVHVYASVSELLVAVIFSVTVAFFTDNETDCKFNCTQLFFAVFSGFFPGFCFPSIILGIFRDKEIDE